MGEKTEVIILYTDTKTRIVNEEYRLRIYKDLLEQLDKEQWKPGKPIKYHIVLFKGKKCILIEPLL